MAPRGDGPHGDIVVFDSMVEDVVSIPEVVVWDEEDEELLEDFSKLLIFLKEFEELLSVS